MHLRRFRSSSRRRLTVFWGLGGGLDGGCVKKQRGFSFEAWARKQIVYEDDRQTAATELKGVVFPEHQAEEDLRSRMAKAAAGA